MFEHRIDDKVSLRLFNKDDAEEFFQLTMESKPYLKEWLGWLDSVKRVEDTAENIQARLTAMAEIGSGQSGIGWDRAFKGKGL
ncbi:hypothetical protein [Pullulanibacillus sp. KACC 23026]|uniref:hypothetical protein n=1 Tax=Pullulanibacillus sp. KACC 23026 TaxID=3028315 RepID=UPI0031B5B9A5